MGRWSGLAVALAAFSVLAPRTSARAEEGGARLHRITHWAFGPWYGTGCPSNGACGCGGAKTMAEEARCQLDRLAEHDIPVTAYVFDGGGWSQADSSATSACTGERCCRSALGDEIVGDLRRRGVRALLHFWGGCHDASQYRRAFETFGDAMLGFYLDDRTDDAESRRCIDFLARVMPGTSDCNLKARQGRPPSVTPQGLGRFGNVGYVGDLPFDWKGLAEGIRRVFDKAALMPAPYNEFTGYAYKNDGAPDEETYTRRLHFGALSPVMANTPYANADPWRKGYSPALLETYRRYSWLHKELVPYFLSLAHAMHERPSETVLRDMNPDAFTTKVGDDLFTAFVTSPGVRTLSVTLPPGRWIDFWDDRAVASGRIDAHPVPLGREPLFVREGALVPFEVSRAYTGLGTKESAGSLTVLAYPAGRSRLRYRDGADEDARRGRWVTFTSELAGNRLALRVDAKLARPVIYRIGRWDRAPGRVVVAQGGRRVEIDGALPGRTLSAAADEPAANGATRSTFFHDAKARRLIVKVVPGT